MRTSMPKSDLGILPLMVAIPFMFYPKVLEGDTQPWVLIGAAIALVSFRSKEFIRRRDIMLILTAMMCIVVYGLRSTLSAGLLRQAYTYVAFAILWIVCDREKGDYFPHVVRATVVLWFAAGLFQYIAVLGGYELEMGRFMPGRSGVPSITAEASYYGSLSMIHVMYLMGDQRRHNGIYVACAVGSVVLSGSLLAMLLLAFPIRRLPAKYRVAAFVLFPILVIGDYYFTSAGLVARIQAIGAQGVGASAVFMDASLNLRIGHLYFTLWKHLVPSVLMVGPIDFMAQYNAFAVQSGLFIETGSEFILPAIGEMVYGAGLFAIALLAMVLSRAADRCTARDLKIERVLFMLACMLNPISLSNIFLIMYAQSRAR